VREEIMNEDRRIRRDRVIIANCSGFFGDRLSAAKEMVQGGPIDFLTGDYLAELTMAILFRLKMKDPKAGGYVPTFLKQMEQVMGECLDREIRVVSNAGGLNPKALAEELQRIADTLGLRPRIAWIEGDDIMARLEDLQTEGEELIHMDKGIPLRYSKAMTLTANAYLGCWGIVKALDMGADIVVGGRIADASLTVGPAAWWHGWKQNDWDRLAGAATAGHIIECGAQATGGNYSFIGEVPDFRNVGFPIAEVFDDGSFVITKHPGTGGLVSVDTVKAQLLYEISDPRYLTPDVIPLRYHPRLSAGAGQGSGERREGRAADRHIQGLHQHYGRLQKLHDRDPHGSRYRTESPHCRRDSFRLAGRKRSVPAGLCPAHSIRQGRPADERGGVRLFAHHSDRPGPEES